jgi:hypothetical protein
MFAKAREVMATRAKLWKRSSNIWLDKYYYFSFPMTYYIHNNNDLDFDYENSYYNQYFRYNRLDYPLQRFRDWIVYRANWFYGSRN